MTDDNERTHALPIPYEGSDIQAARETVPVVLFDGPHDGRETTVKSTLPSYIAIEETLCLYKRTERRAKDGRIIYVYDQDGTENVRLRWIKVHGF